MILSLLALGFTGASLPFRVDGDGYLRFLRDGRVVYAASGELTVADGALGLAGAALIPTIPVPAGASAISSDLEGHIYAQVGGQRIALGQLVLAVFPSGCALAPSGSFVVATERPRLGSPGEGTNGVFRGPSEEKSSIATKIVRSAIPGATPHEALHGIMIHLLTEVEGATFTLGEIADIPSELRAKLANVVVGDTPPTGVQRPISTLSLRSRLAVAGVRAAGFDIQVPAGAGVIRKSQHVTPEQFAQAAQDATKSAGKVDAGTLDFLAPLGSLALEVERTVRGDKAITVTVAVKVDGRRINSRQVTLTPEQTEGVHGGQSVKVRLRAAGATMEVDGRAQGTAWVGGEVTVTTTAGDRPVTHRGRVVAPGTVEVKL